MPEVPKYAIELVGGEAIYTDDIHDIQRALIETGHAASRFVKVVSSDGLTFWINPQNILYVALMRGES